MLARHGYGVLLFDRRGEGSSDGEPNAFGWGGDRDVKAAIDFLQPRPDVDRDRIGGIGLSVGGEMMLEAAAETDDLKAVVSEGAGARAFSEELDEQDVTASAGRQGCSTRRHGRQDRRAGRVHERAAAARTSRRSSAGSRRAR